MNEFLYQRERCYRWNGLEWNKTFERKKRARNRTFRRTASRAAEYLNDLSRRSYSFRRGARLLSTLSSSTSP